MHFGEKMISVSNELKNLGHTPILSNFIKSFINQDNSKKEKIKLKQEFEKKTP